MSTIEAEEVGNVELFLYERAPDGAQVVPRARHTGEWCDIGWSTEQVVRNVVDPTLTVYLPDPADATGAGVVLCPGGGWHFLASVQEGADVAKALNAQGIAAFVLKYRLVPTGVDYVEDQKRNMSDSQRRARCMADLAPKILSDGQQAMRLVHENAEHWDVDPRRVGMMGYSAGGNVVLNVALEHTDDCRPAFVAAIYTAGWNDLPAPSGMPLFALCTADDAMAFGNSLRLAQFWKDAGNTVELHVYAKGGHGFCLRKQGLPVDDWLTRFTDWLNATGFTGSK